MMISAGVKPASAAHSPLERSPGCKGIPPAVRRGAARAAAILRGRLPAPQRSRHLRSGRAWSRASPPAPLRGRCRGCPLSPPVPTRPALPASAGFPTLLEIPVPPALLSVLVIAAIVVVLHVCSRRRRSAALPAVSAVPALNDIGTCSRSHEAAEAASAKPSPNPKGFI